MTPNQMADIHRAAFLNERGWNADEFSALLAQPYCAAFSAQGGFALTRTLAGESELLTLAVDPARQRRGIAGNLITRWIEAIQSTTETAFLEVAADNHGAIALYTKRGFTQSGLRKGYYPRTNGPSVDAVLMSRALTSGKCTP